MKKPTMDPLTMGQKLSCQSFRLGNSPLMVFSYTHLRAGSFPDVRALQRCQHTHGDRYQSQTISQSEAAVP